MEPLYQSQLTKERVDYNVELYGGAITARLNPKFKNLSDFRPVPDNQEAFINVDTVVRSSDDTGEKSNEDNDRSSGMANSASLIVELLDSSSVPSEESGTSDAAKYYFNDLASVNDCKKTEIIAIESFENTQRPIDFMPNIANSNAICCLIGKHVGIQGTDDEVTLVLVLIRLVEKHTDVLLLLNLPYFGSCEDLISNLVNDSTNENENLDKIMKDLKEFIRSFNIIDWSLFGDEE